MKMYSGFSYPRIRAVALMLFTVLLVVGLTVDAGAQTTTATLRGRVLAEDGSPVAGADIVATNSNTGFTHLTVSGDNGNFQLAGLAPGTYTILVASAAYEAKTEEKTVLIGQTLDLNFRLAPSTVLTESITVTGDDVLVETRSSEIGTNVTRREIETLPQGNRNFLNFAALAPGVTASTDEFRKEVRSGGQPASATNVFIDGVSFKNDVIQGGVVGQDASRGNPFPQNAVQEFRVITQNYSAEYQKASSAIITAVTKSGGNSFNGEIFGYYQDKDFVAANHFDEEATPPRPKAEYERTQLGLSIGGPIIRDKFHFFGSYESHEESRQNTVTLGNRSPAALARFGEFEGTFTSPFDSTLLFGKLTFQPNQSQIIDLSVQDRHETDIRNFGGQTSFEAAENVKNDVTGTILRHQFTSNTWLNEASLSYQDYKFNPVPLNGDQVGLDFQGIIRTGGRDTEQLIQQKRLAFRDDITFSGINMIQGSHTVKVGFTADSLDYNVTKDFAGNPVFRFRPDNLTTPFEATYGFGNPDLNASNEQFGIYGQDEWSVNDRLTLNLGIRWDYETDMFDTDYQTPANVRAAFSPFFDDSFFSDGNDRPVPKDLFQPRLGFSYDFSGTGKTVVYGGAGRYYNRVAYNDILDVRFRQQFAVGTFRFSTDGLPRDGFPTVIFRPEFMTEAGLRGLLASGTTGQPEVFLINNNIEVPYSDQWNLGVRQTFGDVVGSLSYGNIKTKNLLTFIFGNRNANGQCCRQLAPGFSNVLLGTDREAWYEAIYLTLNRPFNTQSRWGGSLAYTYAQSEQNGGDLFSLDFITPQDYPRYKNAPENTLVLSGIVAIPWDARFSTLITYRSGEFYTIADASRGFGPNEFRLRPGAGEGDDFQAVDLRLEKDFGLPGGTSVGVILEAFNAFNNDNFGCYNSFIARLPEVNANFGQPGCLVGPGRRFQVGARFQF